MRVRLSDSRGWDLQWDVRFPCSRAEVRRFRLLTRSWDHNRTLASAGRKERLLPYRDRVDDSIANASTRTREQQLRPYQLI